MFVDPFYAEPPICLILGTLFMNGYKSETVDRKAFKNAALIPIRSEALKSINESFKNISNLANPTGTSTKRAISMKKGPYSKIERQLLEKEFRANQYPSNEKIIEIGELLSRTVSQIKHWFNDQRYKVRNKTSGRRIQSAKNATSESIVRSVSVQSISSKNKEKHDIFEDSKFNKSENSENESSTITKNNIPKSVKLILESEFLIDQYPTKEKIAELAQTCNRTKKIISQWFCGKRLSSKSKIQKQVSKNEISDENISTADYDTKSKRKSTTFHSIKQKLYSDDEISKLERGVP